jgi:hypothetical protein
VAQVLQESPAERAGAAATVSASAAGKRAPSVGRRRRPPSVWKLSYFEAEWDSVRTNISIEEITAYLWRFRFLHYPSPYFVVRFNPDFTYDSCMFTTSLPWRLVSSSCIQVDAYPVLHASRNKENWGWSLQNMHVRMDQIDIPCSLYAERQAWVGLHMMEWGHYDTLASYESEEEEDLLALEEEEEEEEEEEGGRGVGVA